MVVNDIKVREANRSYVVYNYMLGNEVHTAERRKRKTCLKGKRIQNIFRRRTRSVMLLPIPVLLFVGLRKVVSYILNYNLKCNLCLEQIM